MWLVDSVVVLDIYRLCKTCQLICVTSFCPWEAGCPTFHLRLRFWLDISQAGFVHSRRIPKNPKLRYLQLFAWSTCPSQQQSYGNSFAPVWIDTAQLFYKACRKKWKQFATRHGGLDWICSCRSRFYGALHERSCLCDHVSKPCLICLHKCPYLGLYHHVMSRQVVCDRCNELTESIIHKSMTSVSSVFPSKSLVSSLYLQPGKSRRFNFDRLHTVFRLAFISTALFLTEE